MRTAPAPDIPPIPGMCPSIAVLAGGGDGGGGSGGSSKDGSGNTKAGAGKDGENAAADGRGAPDPKKYPECGTASHPVDVVTGRAFTHPILDLELTGPLPLRFERVFSSKMAGRDAGLGFGWGHTFGWEIEVGRRQITVWNEQGTAVDFPMIPAGAEVIGPWGWVLRRETWGFAVDADDGLWHIFSASEDEGKRFRLTAIEDRNRNRIAITYDDGRLVEVKDSAGRLVRVVPTREGRIGSIQVQNAVAQGQWIAFATYTYDDRGDLITVTDADGHTYRYAYDEDHRLTADTDRTGLCFHFVYDREGRCVEAWGDYPGKRDPSIVEGAPKYLYDGRTRLKGIHHCKFEYSPDGYTEVIDSTQVRRFFGTKHGTLSKAVEGGGVMTAIYRDDGHIMARTDPMGGTTSFDRDARGRVLKVVDPLGRTTTIDRDAAGLPTQVVDAAGGLTVFDRDRFGNVLSAVDPTGAIRSFTYDTRGLLTAVVDPNGARTTFEHDAHGNLVTIVQPNGGTFRYTYDAFGRRTSDTDPLGAAIRYTYSNRGDLLSKQDALGGVSRYSYDGEGHVTQIVDPQGRVTELTWGGYHKLCARRDRNGHELRLGYNVEGELVEMRNERGEVHLLERDSSGRLLSETTFDGRTVQYKNDLLGRAVSIKAASGDVTKLTYDVAGQLVGREHGDGSAQAFEYNARGELVGAVGGAGEIRFERDGAGRVVREIQVVGDEEQSVEIDYDVAGRRVARRTSLGHTESVERDAMGARLRTVLDGAHEVACSLDVLGREIARELPRGGRIESAFDPGGRLSMRRALRRDGRAPSGPAEPEWIAERAGNITAETTYRYGWESELLGAWDRARGGVEYQLDPVGQLLARAPEKARPELFRWDATGNLYEDGAGAPPRAYGKGNVLLRKGDTEYAWNRDGRLTEKRVRDAVTGRDAIWRYAWDGAGLLRSVTRPDGTVVEFTYDAFARRVQKRVAKPLRDGAAPVPVSLTRFVWDGNVLVHEIRSSAQSSGDPVVEERTYCFADAGFEPVAHRDKKRDDVAAGQPGGSWFHYVNDPLGVPTRLVDEDGNVACDLDREAWGAMTPAAGARTTTPIRHPGQYEDEETGLFYNRHRYYDPETGRYISVDPIEAAGGSNAFRYTPNPMDWLDPLGLMFSDSTRQLGNAMGGASTFQPGQTPHHIVQQGAPGAAGQAILARNGIGVHDAENGARLWGTHPNQVAQAGHPGRGCAGYHAGTDIHGAAAQARVANELATAEAAGGGPGTPGGRAAVINQLNVIRNRQQTGMPGTR